MAGQTSNCMPEISAVQCSPEVSGHNITRRRLHYSRHWKIKAGGRAILTTHEPLGQIAHTHRQIALLHFFSLPSSLTEAHFQFFCLNYFLLVGFTRPQYNNNKLHIDKKNKIELLLLWKQIFMGMSEW